MRRSGEGGRQREWLRLGSASGIATVFRPWDCSPGLNTISKMSSSSIYAAQAVAESVRDSDNKQLAIDRGSRLKVSPSHFRLRPHNTPCDSTGFLPDV
jgi:hypothetical protein